MSRQKHPLNNLKLILLSYKKVNENIDVFLERVLNDKSIMRELMNSVNPVMGYSQVVRIIEDPDFINSLEEEMI